MRKAITALVLLVTACSTPSSPVVEDSAAIDAPPSHDATPDVHWSSDHLFNGELVADSVDIGRAEDLPVAFDFVSQCEAGQGCFLDQCSENSDCQSGWCVEHMGERVCSKACTEECAPGWQCQQVADRAPDLVFVCVSQFANLCRPCAHAADCSGTAGTEAACVDYGEEGSFCGGTCLDTEDCPWGFTCTSAASTDGVETMQCVADAGVCPCAGTAIELGLWTPCLNENDDGACAGKRVCTPEGLSNCDAEEPAQETCNGLDDNCNGEVDEPSLVEGAYIGLCDDQNDCTEDACKGETGCTNVAVEAGECVDNDPCTVGDHCEAGVCVGTPVQCDDDNPCTEDSCDGFGGCQFSPIQVPCDDGLPCTVGDLCADGECSGTPIACDCQTDADCADLEDGDLCNGTLVCDTSTLPHQCVVEPTSIIQCPPSDDPSDPCVGMVCQPDTGACEVVPVNDGFGCSDANECTIGDNCQDGLCQSGELANCQDGNPCTDDSCDPDQGCLYSDNVAPCSDGDSCTLGDTCGDGACQPGPPLNCDDANPCTLDGCESAKGCYHEVQAGPCDDGNACTSGDQCIEGECVHSALDSCDDDNLCTTDSCDPLAGCVHSLNSVPCDDENVCTFGDHCSLGECISSGTLSCDDANPCTDDACHPASGCQFTPNNQPCDDSNACTDGDQCAQGTCQGGLPLDCDDDNPCTVDMCSPESGCNTTPANGPCDDGDACTDGDECVDGECTGSLVDCNDNNPCTTDACDNQLGCQYAYTNQPCDDGDACTDVDVCTNGNCLGEVVVCNDENVCTDDSCDSDSGCIFVPNQADCDNGKCVDGECVDVTCKAPTGNLSKGAVAELYGHCWYLTNPGGNCDATCAELAGTNLTAQADNLWPNNCPVAGADDVAAWFYSNGNPGNWTGAGGGTNGHSLGYGYTNSSYYGKCTTGTSMNIGSYPGATNDSPTRMVVCPCFKQ